MVSTSAIRVWIFCLMAGLAPASPAANDLIERFAALDTVWASEISPDGRHLALGCARRGVRSACVYELDAIGKPPLVYSTAPDQRLVGISWAGPEWLILNLSMTSDLTRRTNNLTLVPVSRALANNIRTQESSSLLGQDMSTNFNLTDISTTPASTPGQVFMRADTWLPGRGNRLGVYRVDLKSGRGELVHTGALDTYLFLLDSNGAPVLRLDYDGDEKRYTINQIRNGRVEHSVERGEVEARPLHAYGFVEAGRKLATAAYAEDGVYTAYLLDASTGEMKPAALDLQGVNVDGWIADGTSDAVVGVRYTDDVPRQKFMDEALENARVMLHKALPGKNLYLDSWSDDRSMITLWAAAAGEPRVYYLFDASHKTLSPVGESRPELAGFPTAPTTRLEYAARDGLPLHAYLTLPPGKTVADGPFPLLLFPHGGPLVRDDATFDWWTSYFAHRGYAVLRPNFRGSDGYGLEFRRKGYGEFGAAMIDDVIDAAKHLIARGVADGTRVCTMGASYGGYAALMVTLRDASLARCVVAVNAVTDPTTLIGERIKWTGENSRAVAFWEDYIGSRYRNKASIAAASPVRSVMGIKVPVLLLHGAEDTNVPIGQSRHLKKQLELAGRGVRLVEFAGDDHFLNTSAVRETLLKEVDAFLAAHIDR